jgi:hypothetical protein
MWSRTVGAMANVSRAHACTISATANEADTWFPASANCAACQGYRFKKGACSALCCRGASLTLAGFCGPRTDANGCASCKGPVSPSQKPGKPSAASGSSWEPWYCPPPPPPRWHASHRHPDLPRASGRTSGSPSPRTATAATVTSTAARPKAVRWRADASSARRDAAVHPSRARAPATLSRESFFSPGVMK